MKQITELEQVKQFVRVLALMLFSFGIVNLAACARVRVEAPKEPIKVDISMRLDIYQHIEKDINDIENIVSGSAEKAQPKGDRSFLNYLMAKAYAQENLPPEVEGAALRRKERRSIVIAWQEKGVIGENRMGLLEKRNVAIMNSSVDDLIRSENEDRILIYKAVSRKNRSTLEEVQGLYAKRLQQDAPRGTPVEAFNPELRVYEWQVKE